MNLKELRLLKHKTAVEAAKKLGILYTSFFRYEQGVRRLSFEQALALAGFYEVTLEEVVYAQLETIYRKTKPNGGKTNE